MSRQLQKRAADQLLDKTITVTIDVIKQTWLDKILKRPKERTFIVRRSCLASLVNFSSNAIDLNDITGETVAALLKSIALDGNKMAKCLAILIENTDSKPKRKLVKFLRLNLDSTEAKALLVKLISHCKIEDFMSSIILIKGMSLLKTEEMIASEQTSGQQLEVQ